LDLRSDGRKWHWTWHRPSFFVVCVAGSETTHVLPTQPPPLDPTRQHNIPHLPSGRHSSDKKRWSDPQARGSAVVAGRSSGGGGIRDHLLRSHFRSLRTLRLGRDAEPRTHPAQPKERPPAHHAVAQRPYSTRR